MVTFHLWTKVLVYLYNHQKDDVTVLDLCKALDIATTSSVSTIIHMLSSKGLISIDRRGRRNNYVMTKNGGDVAECLNKVFVLLKIRIGQ